MRHSAFLGTPLSNWLTNSYDVAGTIMRMSGHIHNNLILGGSYDYVATSDTGNLIGAISYSVKGNDKPPSILAKLEAYLFSWEFYLLNFATNWRDRGNAKERTRKRRILVDALEEGQKRNIHDKGITTFVYVSLLAVDPSRQGEGTGRELLQLPLALARELQLPCYLESTTDGYQFYLKNGFKDTGGDVAVDDGDHRIWTSNTVIWYPK